MSNAVRLGVAGLGTVGAGLIKLTLKNQAQIAVAAGCPISVAAAGDDVCLGADPRDIPGDRLAGVFEIAARESRCIRRAVRWRAPASRRDAPGNIREQRSPYEEGLRRARRSAAAPGRGDT